MPPLSKTTSEEFEQDQRAIEGADENKPFITRVSVTIAILAVIGVTLGSLESIETSASSNASNTALLHQDRATDAWNAFEAKNIKAMLQTLAPAAGAGSQAGAVQAGPDRHPDKDANGLASYAREQERLSEDKLREAERRGERHHVLTIAVTLIQVAIAIATISIIARGQRWPWYGAMALGLAGILTGAYAYR
ncbi:MAG: hypothetical protein JWO28_1681 [Hyphomicrobiales bacterium]|jgi:hypothetical protein|nr:hypothetical protein [Hyphomicrobiales bacterium]